MKHTIGPWTAWCKGGWRISGDGERIASLEEIDPETEEANAHLMAVSPDMLKALENIRDTVESCYVAGGWVPLDAEEMTSIANLAQTVIANATGETP